MHMPAREMRWLPNPPRGTQICAGFDGSEFDDWTALKCRTRAGRLFTPRYGPDRRPTIWNPDEWGGEIPRAEVKVAVAEVFSTWRVARMYCDPHGWYSEIGEWAEEHGEKRVVEWATNRDKAMFEAIKRMETDLRTRVTTHDGCPITTLHVSNARKVARNSQRYGLGKPVGEYHRKIDAAVASVLAGEAAGDATSTPGGWDIAAPAQISTVMYGFS
ncbi:terminase large subunit, nuclease domain [Gordonia phage Nyceirae]|uniref:Terminase large subunit (Nuclease domain) n=1 Tax=Gordonia phage Nyceirae TaxID=1887651 RepID=A0A1C9EHV3_9CAUD|nr:terminase large subunit [Gordonia phage Nyceirae]AON97369.1 terminase large subunit, nuclease domain [Gordonia phage Nyceirae]